MSMSTRSGHGGRGAVILRPAQDYAYGERQYSANVWTFTQSIADVRPEEWGGEPVQL
jgi:hypothetical protein